VSTLQAHHHRRPDNGVWCLMLMRCRYVRLKGSVNTSPLDSTKEYGLYLLLSLSAKWGGSVAVRLVTASEFYSRKGTFKLDLLDGVTTSKLSARRTGTV
jgi:hypothetical protein